MQTNEFLRERDSVLRDIEIERYRKEVLEEPGPNRMDPETHEVKVENKQ